MQNIKCIFKVTGSQQFPLPFCNVRWVEFKLVAERPVNIWKNIKKIVFHWEKFKKNRKPDGKCYNTAVLSVNNKFIILKLHFFIFVANIVQPFLKKHQSSDPLITFLFNDIRYCCLT